MGKVLDGEMTTIDYKRLALDCEEYATACYASNLWALASHERTCRDAILALLTRAEAAEKRAASAEYRVQINGQDEGDRGK